MRDQASGELAGWLAYIRIDDEVQAQRTAIAILKAFGGGSKQSTKQVVDEDEEVIDTTKPEFAQYFKGFTGVPGGKQPQRPMPMRSTEILLG